MDSTPRKENTMADEQPTLPGMGRSVPQQRTGEDLKRAGIERAMRNERSAWKRLALEVVRKVATEKDYFTPDHIHHRAEKAAIGEPHHPNVWSGVIRLAVHVGIMARTGRYVPSTRDDRRGAVVPIYRSNLR
jgi:hypothetical protein